MNQRQSFILSLEVNVLLHPYGLNDEHVTLFFPSAYFGGFILSYCDGFVPLHGEDASSRAAAFCGREGHKMLREKTNSQTEASLNIHELLMLSCAGKRGCRVKMGQQT